MSRFLFLLLIPTYLIAGIECVEYDFEKSYVDPLTQETILKFYNQCNTPRQLRLCLDLGHDKHSHQQTRISGQSGKNFNVGRLPHGAVFYYSDDGDPAPCP